MLRIRTILVGLTLLTTACGSVATAEVPQAAATSDALVIRVEQVGGFVAPATNYSRIPSLSIYADGRVIWRATVPEPYPGPALPTLGIRHVSTQTVRRLADQARAAGVGRLTDFGMPGIADATSTRFTVSGRTTEVYALSESSGTETGLTARQRANRARMRTLLTTLNGVETGDPAPSAGPGAQVIRPYRPTAIAALTSPWRDEANSTGPASVAWPGAALPGRSLGGGTELSCVTSTGAAAARVLAAAATAHPQTPWAYRGHRYAITLRPLLPDEHSCADLGR